MQRLHLDLIVIDLLPDASELIPHVPPLLVYGSLFISLLLRVLMEDLLQVQDLILLGLCLQYYILFKFLFIDLFGPFINPFALFLLRFDINVSDQCQLLTPVHVHHASIRGDALVNEELLAHVDLHVVGVVGLEPLVERLRLVDHFEALLLDLVAVVHEGFLTLDLEAVEFYLPAHSVCLQLELLLTGDFLGVVEGLELDLLRLVHLEAVFVLFQLFLKAFLLVHVFKYIEFIGLVSLDVSLGKLRVIVVQAVLQLVVNPVDIVLLVVLLDHLVYLLGLLHNVLEIGNLLVRNHLFSVVSDWRSHHIALGEDLELALALGQHIETLVKPIFLGQIAGVLIVRTEHIMRVG